MNQRLHRAFRLHHALLMAVMSLLFSSGLAGCRHKVVTFAMPAGMGAPVALEDPASGQAPVLIATLPTPELPPLPVEPPPPLPRRRAPTVPKEEAPPPVASEAAPATLAIGSLSTGVDVTPQIQQQTQDLIASIGRRAARLPARIASTQKRQIGQVRHFLEQALEALGTGDAEGAKNLATKASLLMDDLEKK